MKILKDWTRVEKGLLFSSIVLVVLVGIIFKSDIITTTCSIIGIITALLLAKGENQNEKQLFYYAWKFW